MESGLFWQPEPIEKHEAPTHTSIAIDRCTPNNSNLRLIPLTSQIIEAMMDFNGSQSSTSLSDKPFYNTFSITSLVREEVQNILHELCVSDQFIRKEEIDALIERCLREKAAIDPQDSKTTTTSGESSPDNQEIEVTVEMLNENDKNKLIVENFQILEQRITNLEERISTVLQTVPKLRHLQAKKFKINTDVIREELRHFMNKMDSSSNSKVSKERKAGGDRAPLPKSDEATAPIDDTTAALLSGMFNPYDDLYYAQRQNALNMLNYKKSLATLELNQRPVVTPLIKPISKRISDPKFKPKQKPVFISD